VRRRHILALFACLAGIFAMPAAAQDKDAYRAGRLPPQRPAGPAGTDDCTAPLPIITVDYIDSGDTSGATGSVDVIPITCNGYYTVVQGPDRVYTFTVTAGNNLNFRLSTSSDDYDPSIYVLGICGDGASCPFGAGADRCRARELPQPAGCPILDSTETFSYSFAPGDYFLYVDSFYPAGNLDAREAGPYLLEVTGSLPVELLEFSVE
jgi:hypothetical protein